MEFLQFLSVIAILVSLSPTPSTTDSVTVDQFWNACTNLAIDPELPNLQYAKRHVETPQDSNCSLISNAPQNWTVTWYYYENYDPSANVTGLADCGHDIATSIISFPTRIFVTTNGTSVGVATGTVISGAYLGRQVLSTTTLIGANTNACSSTIGIMEAQSGMEELTILPLTIIVSLFPLVIRVELATICTGITTHTYCPGIH